MIIGSLHLRNVRRVGKGMFSTESEQQTDDIVRFQFADQDAVEVVKMLESVLTTVKQQLQADVPAKTNDPVEANDA